MTPHLIQLERDILRCESWLEHCPDKTKIRDEIVQYVGTLKHNYHAITGKPWEERRKPFERTSGDYTI